jgi:hypothetical protein
MFGEIAPKVKNSFSPGNPINTPSIFPFGTSASALDSNADTGATFISNNANTVAQVAVANATKNNFVMLWSGRSSDTNPLIAWSSSTNLRLGTCTAGALNTAGFSQLFTLGSNGIFTAASGLTATSGSITATNGNFVIGTTGNVLLYPNADGDKIWFFNVSTQSKIDTSASWNVNYRAGATGTSSSGIHNWYTVNGSNVWTNRMSLSNAGVLALTGGTLTITSAGNVASTISSTTTGSANNADLFLSRGDQANGFCRVAYQTGSTSNWTVGNRSGTTNYTIFDEVNSLAQLTMTQGSGVTGVSTFAGSVVASTLTLTNTGGNSLQMANTGQILGKNTGGTYETAMYPRWSDNALYLSGGSGGMHIRVSNTTDAIVIDSSGNTTLSAGNLIIGTATTGLKQAHAAVSASTANSYLVTGVVLTSGSSGTINNSIVTTSHIGRAIITSVSGTPTYALVTCGTGTFTVTGAATDNSTYAVVFMLPI